MQLIVVGFHRSGTSLLSQLLHRSGLFLGDEMLGARPSNQYGHYEDRKVLELHRRILAAHGLDWQVHEPTCLRVSPEHWRAMQDFVQHRDALHANWGFKDPRVCFFLGHWRHVLPSARFIVVYRDPADCVRSLETRHAREYLEGVGKADRHLQLFRIQDHGLRMWDTYNRAVLSFVRHNVEDCMVVPFSLLSQGYGVVRAVNARFGAQLDEVPTEAVFDPGVAGVRSNEQWVHSRHVATRVGRTWDFLEALAAETGVTS